MLIGSGKRGSKREAKKTGRRKGAGRVPIITPKRKRARGEAVRRIFLGISSSIVLVLLLTLAFLLIRERVVFPHCPLPQPNDRREITDFDENEGLVALNADIDAALAGSHVTGDLLVKKDGGENTGRSDEPPVLEETYRLPANISPDAVTTSLEALADTSSEWATKREGVLAVESSDAPDGTREIVFSMRGNPIRKIILVPHDESSPAPQPKVRGRLAIIMDDMGINTRYWDEIFSLKYPLTISILPGQPYSKEIAKRAHKKGWEVLLHLPLEPVSYPKDKPGPGALFTFMTEGEIREQIRSDLDAVPYVEGVNNHMGSKFTQDEEKMRLVLMEIKKKNIFFVDSKTISNSCGYRIARELGIPALSRSVFLDNGRDVNKISGEIRTLMDIAKKEGIAVGICHPYPETIQALKKMEPVLMGGTVKVVPAGELFNSH